MDPYTPPPPIRTPKGHRIIETDEHRKILLSLMLGASGIFSLGAAVGSGGAPVFLFFTLMFLSFGYCMQKTVQWQQPVQEEAV